MKDEDFAELSAAAALHALSPEDDRRFRAACDTNPGYEGIAVADEETAALLSDAAASASPPPELRSALLARIAVAPQDGAAGEARTEAPPVTAPAVPPVADPGTASPIRSRGLRILFALAACLALLVGVGVGAALLQGQLRSSSSVVALEQIQDAPDAQQVTVTLASGGTATAHWSASLGTAVLVTDGIATPAAGEAYELWFVRGETPVSAGVFALEDGGATALLNGDMQAGDVIAVTVEQESGSPTGQPTSDPVVVIPTA